MGIFDTWQDLGTLTGAKLIWRERLAMGPEGEWSLAELGFDDRDQDKLRRWLRRLTPSRVSAERRGINRRQLGVRSFLGPGSTSLV